MVMFPHRSAPVYDDNEGQTVPMRHLLANLVGQKADPYSDEEDPTPWINSPEHLLDWMRQVHIAPPILNVLDLHDSNYLDLNSFGENIGTEGGELTGWRFAEHVLIPEILERKINYRVPLIFVSSQPSALMMAREEAAHSENARKYRDLGLSLTFLAKPQKEDDLDARAFRRETMRLAFERLEEGGLLKSPLMELGIAREDFDHFAFVRGIQQLWGLTDHEMARVLYFQGNAAQGTSPEVEFQAFQKRQEMPPTAHLADHIERLFSLKSRLSGLKRHAPHEERMAYDRAWLRTPRADLAGAAPLHLLLEGKPEYVDMLLNYFEGIEVDRTSWPHGRAARPRRKKQA